MLRAQTSTCSLPVSANGHRGSRSHHDHVVQSDQPRNALPMPRHVQSASLQTREPTPQAKGYSHRNAQPNSTAHRVGQKPKRAKRPVSAAPRNRLSQQPRSLGGQSKSDSQNSIGTATPNSGVHTPAVVSSISPRNLSVPQENNRQNQTDTMANQQRRRPSPPKRASSFTVRDTKPADAPPTSSRPLRENSGTKPAAKPRKIHPSPKDLKKQSEKAVERTLRKRFAEIFKDLLANAKVISQKGLFEETPRAHVRKKQAPLPEDTKALTVTQILATAQHTLGCDWLLIQDMVLQQQLLRYEDIDENMFANLMVKYLRDVSSDCGGISGLLSDGASSSDCSSLTPQVSATLSRQRCKSGVTPHVQNSSSSHTRLQEPLPSAKKSTSFCLSPRTAQFAAQKPLIPRPPSAPPPPRSPFNQNSFLDENVFRSGGDSQELSVHTSHDAYPARRPVARKRSFRARRNRTKPGLVQNFQLHASTVTEEQAGSVPLNCSFQAEVRATQGMPHEFEAGEYAQSQTQSTTQQEAMLQAQDQIPLQSASAGQLPLFPLSMFTPSDQPTPTPFGTEPANPVAPSNAINALATAMQSGSRVQQFTSEGQEQSVFDRLARPATRDFAGYDAECTFTPNIEESQRRWPAV